jgi:putative membrane protein
MSEKWLDQSTVAKTATAFSTLSPTMSLQSKEPKIDRQREHQANERTFLAWLRTSIALIGFGIAIARFGLFLRQLHLALTQQQASVHASTHSESLGVSLVILGIIVVMLAGWQYNQVFWQIERADYRPTRLLVWMVLGAVIAVGIASIPIILENHATPTLPPQLSQPFLPKSAPLNP